MKPRDDRSRAIFKFICRFFDDRGFAPSLAEIARDQGYRSNSGVLRHLDKLEKWGWIERYHGQSRSIRILRRDRARLSDKSSSSRQHLRQR